MNLTRASWAVAAVPGGTPWRRGHPASQGSERRPWGAAPRARATGRLRACGGGSAYTSHEGDVKTATGSKTRHVQTAQSDEDGRAGLGAPSLGAPSPFYPRPRAARGRRVRPADGRNEAGRAPENGRCRRGAVLTPPLPPAPEPNGRPAGSQVRLGGLGGACDGAGPAGGSGDAEGGSRSLTRHSPTPRTQNPEHRWPGPNTRWPRGAARPAPGRPDHCRPGSDAVPTLSAEGAVSAPPTGAKANGP